MIEVAYKLLFEPVSLSMQEQATELLKQSDFRGCEYNFSTIFLWRNIFHTHAALAGGRLFVRSEAGGSSYLFPVGNGDLKDAMLALEQDACENGELFRMHSVNQAAKEQLEQLFPGKYAFAPSRRDFDYIYDAEKLRFLRGKKLHGKRNHINRFLSAYDGQWQYESIGRDNLAECFAMNKEWCAQNDCALDKSKQQEQCAVKEAFDHFFDLPLQGGLLRVNGKVVAFSMGEPLNSDTYLAHIEKGLIEYPGVYPMINQQFVQANCDGFTYVNREDDTGSEGLRKSKMSYYPAFLETKYLVWLQEQLTGDLREQMRKMEEEA